MNFSFRTNYIWTVIPVWKDLGTVIPGKKRNQVKGKTGWIKSRIKESPERGRDPGRKECFIKRGRRSVRKALLWKWNELVPQNPFKKESPQPPGHIRYWILKGGSEKRISKTDPEDITCQLPLSTLDLDGVGAGGSTDDKKGFFLGGWDWGWKITHAYS